MADEATHTATDTTTGDTAAEATGASSTSQPTPQNAIGGAEQRAAMKGVLAKLMSKARNGEGPATDDAGEGDPDAGADVRVNAGQDAPTTEGGTDAPADTVAKEGHDADPDAKKYRDALKRAQWADEDLANLPPERLAEKGKAALKREKDQADFANRYHEMKRAFEQFERDKAKGGDAPAGGTTAGTPAASPQDDAAFDAEVNKIITEALDPLKKGDNADLYADLEQPFGVALTGMAGKLGALVKAQLSQVKGQYEQQFQQVIQANNALAFQADRLELRQAAVDSGLVDEYPELKKGDVFARVVSKARSLANLDNQDYLTEDGDVRWDRLAADAAALVIGKKNTIKQTQARLAQRQQRIVNGQPAPDSGQMQRPSTLSPKERMLRAAQMLAQGKGKATVQRELAKAS